MIPGVPQLAGDLYVKAELVRTDPKWKDYEVTASCSKHNSDGALDPIMPIPEARDNYIFKETSRGRALLLKCEKPEMGETSPVLQVLFPCNDSCGELY